ncbi:FHA domain-containing protein [Nocardioides limicola]|uniref:FHA domain-containing protein n=1 Tax=Nocardioides limicola TaxID=2803368 RepID=UPI00193C563D|nr:FHA domain-containing protein [Nocardioides sp. DJM-14]
MTRGPTWRIPAAAVLVHGPAHLLVLTEPHSPGLLDRLGQALLAEDVPAAVEAVAGPESAVSALLLRHGVGEPEWRHGPAFADTGTGGASGLIDGIPAHLLTGTPTTVDSPATVDRPAMSSLEPATTVEPVSTLDPEPGPVADAAASASAEPREHTVLRGAPARARFVTPGHLQQPTADTVLAVHCPVGHLTPPEAPRCRICGAEVPREDPVRVPRPVLGVLLLPSSEQVPLDRGVVFGRKPSPIGSDWPHLVHLPHDSTYLSRMHLQVELDGWLVLVRDLGSASGTTLRTPGRAPERLRAGEPHILEPGQSLDLADVYEIVYEVS